jgi:acyl carrier protein
MLELVYFIENSYKIQINPFQFLKFYNIIVYHLVSLF